MRVGLFTDSYLPRVDGIAISVESFRIGLESLGHEVFVFCPKRPEPFVDPSQNIYRFPSLPSLAYEQYRDTFPFTPKHIRDVSKLKLDIVHTFTPTQIGLFGVFIAHRNKIPLVTTCSADFELINEYRRFGIAPFILALGASIATRRLLSLSDLKLFLKPAYPLKKWQERMAAAAYAFYNNQCDLVITPSLKTKRTIAPYIKTKVTILPCGIDLGLVPDKKDYADVRGQYGIDKEAVVFVSTSRLVREKRIDFLIRAYSLLSSDAKEKSTLLVVGDGPQASYLKNLTKDLGLEEKVIFTGSVEHKRVFEIVSACDIFVHASLRETQGLVINEAAACGKPLVMVDRDVNTVLREGENGFFAKDNILDFSDKMSKLLSNIELRTRYGSESRSLAKNTSQEQVALQLSRLYENLIDDRSNN